MAQRMIHFRPGRFRDLRNFEEFIQFNQNEKARANPKLPYFGNIAHSLENKLERTRAFLM